MGNGTYGQVYKVSRLGFASFPSQKCPTPNSRASYFLEPLALSHGRGFTISLAHQHNAVGENRNRVRRPLSGQFGEFTSFFFFSLISKQHVQVQNEPLSVFLGSPSKMVEGFAPCQFFCRAFGVSGAEGIWEREEKVGRGPS